MKTLTRGNRSIYIFEDSQIVTLTPHSITVGSPAEFIIGDCNNSNTVLHEGVSAPESWVGHKYDFDGATWTLNPDWVEPSAE